MAGEEPEDFVVALIGGKPVAFPIRAVREVVPLVEPTPVPSWPGAALGMIEIRGELVPLLDASDALGLPASPLATSQLIIALEVAGRVWGILVDQIDGVRSAVTRPVGALGGGQEPSALLLGMISEPDMSLIVLNPEELLRRLTEGVPLDSPAGKGP